MKKVKRFHIFIKFISSILLEFNIFSKFATYETNWKINDYRWGCK
jgi:hypothetical protein